VELDPRVIRVQKITISEMGIVKVSSCHLVTNHIFLRGVLFKSLLQDFTVSGKNLIEEVLLAFFSLVLRTPFGIHKSLVEIPVSINV
jgi:hypothetical protein